MPEKQLKLFWDMKKVDFNLNGFKHQKRSEEAIVMQVLVFNFP